MAFTRSYPPAEAVGNAALAPCASSWALARTVPSLSTACSRSNCTGLTRCGVGAPGVHAAAAMYTVCCVQFWSDHDNEDPDLIRSVRRRPAAHDRDRPCF